VPVEHSQPPIHLTSSSGIRGGGKWHEARKEERRFQAWGTLELTTTNSISITWRLTENTATTGANTTFLCTCLPTYLGYTTLE